MGTIFVDNIKQQSSQGSGTITIGASGETVALASGVKQSNILDPMFQAELDSEQSISDATTTIVAFETKTFDTDNCYSTSTYRFTPNKAGKYFVHAQTFPDSQGNSDLDDCFLYLYKNGSEIHQSGMNFGDNDTRNTTLNLCFIVDMNGSSDYLDVRVFIDDNSGTPRLQSTKSAFLAYRIAT